MTELCQDCDEDVEEDDMRECVVCSSRVCAWCMEGPICLPCAHEDEGDRR